MELASDITADDLKVFIEEAEEQLQLLDEDIVRLEKEEDNEALLQEIFRAAHTLKGSSAMLGYVPMAELAHAMETLLDKVRKGTLAPTSVVIDALLHSLDGLSALKAALTSPDEAEIDIAPMVKELDEAAAVEGAPASGSGGGAVRSVEDIDEAAGERLNAALAAGQSAYIIKVSFERQCEWLAVRSFQVVTDLSQEAEVIDSVPSLQEIEEEKVGPGVDLIVTSTQGEERLKSIARSVADVESVEIRAFERRVIDRRTTDRRAADSSQGATPQVHTAQTVRIDVERLDSMMNLVGELVITSSRMLQISKMLESRDKDDQVVEELGRSSAHTTKVVNELQEDIMRIRMLPIGTVFSGFPRMIRDLAQTEKKEVEFIVEGQETGIDRTVIEHIRDPLVHLLRNAVDHGIETADAREASGKPRQALLRLSACHEEGHMVITIEDDGNGIDGAVVKEAAVRKGFLSAEDAARMSDEQGVDLIFGSGMSTKKQTTEVSGRGVGLDIVRKNLETLNGYVQVDTKVGKGSKFTLRLPLTLATVDSLLISCSGQLYGIPVVSVLEATSLESGQIHSICGREAMRFRGKVLPLFRLSKTLGTNGGDASCSNGPVPVVVVRSRDRQVGLAADALMGKQEIVVKAISDHLGDVKGISGAAVLGDGQMALVVDVPSLVDSMVMESSLS